MNFLHDKRKRNTNTKSNTIIIVVVCILFLFSIFKLGGNVARTIAKPFWSVHTYFTNSVAGIVEHFHTRQYLLDENKRLQDVVDSDTQKMFDYDAVVLENTQLKSLLSRVQNPHSKILANVIVRPPLSAFDNIVIDIGTDNGIEKDQKVFFGENEILGTVTDVGTSTSVVSLFTLSGTETSALVLDTVVTLVGRGGGNFEITIPKNVEIPTGTLVTMPGITRYTLGTVDRKISKSDDPYTKYLVRAPENLHQLQTVLVEK